MAFRNSDFQLQLLLQKTFSINFYKILKIYVQQLDNLTLNKHKHFTLFHTAQQQQYHCS